MPHDGLVIENASKHFASFVALQSVDLCIERGQFVLLAGANGAGKSTLLRLMAGISRPSSGRVLIDGKDPQRDAAARSAIGFLSHHTLLYDDLSAEENLGFHGYLPRDDLADCIVETLRNFLTLGKTIQLVAGKDKVKDAIAGVVGGGDLPPIA